MPRIGLLLGHLPQARTTRLLASLLHRYAPRGTELVEIDYHDLPHHAPYTDVPTPVSAVRLKRALADVDGLLVVAPTHERSIPGALKNAIDWAAASPNMLAGMPTVIAGAAAPRRGHFVALTHLRTVLGDAGAELKAQPEHTLEITAADFDPSGVCINVELGAAALDLVSATAGYVVHLARADDAARGARVRVATDPDTEPTARIAAVNDDAARMVAAPGIGLPSDPVAAVEAADREAAPPASPSVGVPTALTVALTHQPME